MDNFPIIVFSWFAYNAKCSSTLDKIGHKSLFLSELDILRRQKGGKCEYDRIENWTKLKIGKDWWKLELGKIWKKENKKKQ